MTTSLRQTPLSEAHVACGAKMVDFGGWNMPVSFEGILAEHNAVRTHAGAFDVSHMGEVDFRGANALEAIQKLVTNDASKLEDGRALYTTACYPDGGIVDDCIVYRRAADDYRIVVNASNISKDVAFFREHADSICDIVDRSDEFGLIAVQGRAAPSLVAGIGDDRWIDVPGFGFAPGQIAGVDVDVARTGYTGEDGFEIFVPATKAADVWNAVLEAGAKPIGLGARDTLRLEARLCLYGNDIDQTTTPLEAGLGWVVKLDKGEFVGSDALREQKANGITRKLVGFRLDGRGIARQHAEVLDADGNVVGEVTSGAPAPTVGGAVGMAYVPKAMSAPGTELQLRQRGKLLTATTVKGPFYRRDY
ncbi:MAG: glycine cleavage system aminomethyltransferase GcvT [Myxococcales bacterium FL481]|nr:MAG: glycine cleavage system aminomethyltransferase GcvT [Myxococcales bacterium FL481]